MNAKKILLVEDSPDDQELIRMAIAEEHIANEIISLSDGAQALDYLFGRGSYDGRDISDTPLVILVDIKLLNVNGLEVLQQLRADPRTSLIPVVILTSSNEEQDIIEGYKFGANSYVRKPVDFTEFLDAAKNLGVYWLVMNQVPSRR